jgi:hypothetical protein
MPPVSPCGRVVDYVRSCFRGYWRFFPDQPDALTYGWLYFAPEGTATIAGPHSFGSGFWNKEQGVYPSFPTGHDPYQGTQWYDGKPPDDLPPDQQIFPTSDFALDLDLPVTPPATRNGFDARCYVVFAPGVDFPVELFYRPDVVDCCWQRVLATLLWWMSNPFPDALDKFRAAVMELWGPDFALVILPLDSEVDRFAWINGPHFQIILRVGTQSWAEIFEQAWHGLQAAHNFGAFSTSPVWHDEALSLVGTLNALGFDPEKPVTFCGHSKGGAVLWILARMMIGANANRDIDVLTFGIPKVGDFRMRNQNFLRETRHVIHRQDVIPLIPPNPISFPLLIPVTSLQQRNNFETWQNFSVYQIVGDGWGNGMEPATELAWQTYTAWIGDILTGQVPGAIAQHFLHSYVAALPECCQDPHFPFTPTLWEMLFGEPDNRDGGMMIGNLGGSLNLPLATGIEIGGAGAWNVAEGGLMIGGAGSRSPIAGDGGLMIGGAGSRSPIAGDGGLRIGGAGSKPPLAGVGGLMIGGAGSKPPLAGVGGLMIGGAGSKPPLAGVGGLMIGGAGDKPPLTDLGGLEIGGAGAKPPLTDLGGLEIGGAGQKPPITGLGGLEIGGAGYLFPLTCAQARLIPFGVAVAFEVSNPNHSWATWPVTASKTYTVTYTVSGGTTGPTRVSTGTCAALVFQFQLAAGGGSNFWVQGLSASTGFADTRSVVGSARATFTIRVDET